MVVIGLGTVGIAVHARNVVVEGADDLDGGLQRDGAELGAGIAAQEVLEANLVGGSASGVGAAAGLEPVLNLNIAN